MTNSLYRLFDHLSKPPFSCEIKNLTVLRIRLRKNKPSQSQGNLHHTQLISVNRNKDLQKFPVPRHAVEINTELRKKKKKKQSVPRRYNRFRKTTPSNPILGHLPYIFIIHNPGMSRCPEET